MELAFESRGLRSICEQQSIAKGELGEDVAEALKHRLADLRAATSIRELMVGKPRTMTVGHMDYLVIDICEGSQMVLKANHPENPLTDDGELDWERVSRIKVIHIGSVLYDYQQ